MPPAADITTPTGVLYEVELPRLSYRSRAAKKQTAEKEAQVVGVGAFDAARTRATQTEEHEWRQHSCSALGNG